MSFQTETPSVLNQKRYGSTTLQIDPQCRGIQRLRKSKKGVDYESLLKGQEAERSRVAKDLHDGLGGILSAVKFGLQKLKGNMQFSEENKLIFERSLFMVDTSISELRRIAHDMMPLELEKFGLNDALQDYCNTINTSDNLEVNYQSFNMNKRLDCSVEINIYRIIQELLNNTVKHAEASEALVQLIRTGNRLSITVEDNGKGFDFYNGNRNKGAGLVNIRDRIDFLKGKIHFQSAPEKGSSIFIELNSISR